MQELTFANQPYKTFCEIWEVEPMRKISSWQGCAPLLSTQKYWRMIFTCVVVRIRIKITLKNFVSTLFQRRDGFNSDICIKITTHKTTCKCSCLWNRPLCHWIRTTITLANLVSALFQCRNGSNSGIHVKNTRRKTTCNSGSLLNRPLWHHPGSNPGSNLKSITHRCYLREVAFERELTKEIICLPLGCLQGGFRVAWASQGAQSSY